MSYIGAQPTSVAFQTDQFSGNGSTVAFTMSVAPASTSSMLVVITGVTQNPTTYSIVGTTLTFSAAPPTGTGNISVRYLGIPASGVTTTAYRTITNFTATAGQTTFSVPSYTVGYIDVFRNGVRLVNNGADFVATNGTTIVLNNACTVGDSVVTESFYVSSVLNAIPATAGAVNSTYITDGAVTTAKIADSAVTRAKMGYAGAVLQVVSATASVQTSTTSTSFVNVGSLSATITPSSSTSKIFIVISTTTQGTATEYTSIARGATELSGGVGMVVSSVPSNYYTPTTLSYLDSPATTSATTYYMQGKVSSGTGYWVSGLSTITLMEIAA